MRKVLYLSHAPADVYAIIGERVPAGFELVTLETPSDEERLAKAADCEVLIVAAYPLRRPLVDAARKLELVHHQGVGWQDTVDADALQQRHIPLALTPEGTSTGVAEHTVLLMLATLKRLPFADSELRAGRFHVNALRPVSRELSGMTIGYVGMGRIARAVAERLLPFGVTGLYYDPDVDLAPTDAERLGLRKRPLNEVLANADILTLHLPLTRATRHLIDDAALRSMKPGAFLINTARGGLVEESALARALTEGRLAGAGLDVFESEPLPAGHPLAGLPNVVLTPHIAAGTRDALRTKMSALFDNVQRFYRGEPLRNQVIP
ncbi:MAG TPA: 2-hydroxyacid dehydrogenase [Casimicrobiaceae bacterium]|jgi:phosphoglycerate dehydrogenase-like enzyme